MIWTEKAWARTNELIAEHFAAERFTEAVALKVMRNEWREIGKSYKFIYGYRRAVANPYVAPSELMHLGYSYGQVKFTRTVVCGRPGWACEETGFVFLDEHEGLELGVILDVAKMERGQR